MSLLTGEKVSDTNSFFVLQGLEKSFVRDENWIRNVSFKVFIKA